MEKDEDITNDVERKILDTLAKFPEGLGDEEFDKILQLDKDDKLKALNELTQKYRISLMETKTGGIIYKFQSKEKAEKYKELTRSEMPIYQMLEESGNKGISVREMKDKTNITTVRLNKLLGGMEKKGLIKFIKSIQAKKKKVWMLIDVEPSAEITGGIWYNELEFDTNLIDVLCEKCLEYLEKQGSASKKEITVYVRTLGLFQADIKEEDMQSILNTLYYDDKIEIAKAGAETIVSAGKGNSKVSINHVYKIKKRYAPEMAILQAPCAFCPLVKECNPEGIINPATCQYLTDWMQSPKKEVKAQQI